jgi:hypothetical protein
MTVLAVGDSVSFGYELGDLPGPVSGPGNYYRDPITGKDIPMNPSRLAFPQLLANQLATDCLNLSLIGGSNDRTFRITVDQVLQKRYDLVVCSWTNIDRFDFVYNNKDIALNVSTSQWQTEQFPWFKSFIADHYSHIHMTYRFYAQLVSLQALLKQLDQPYVFVNGCGSNSMTGFTAHCQHHASHIDTNKYFMIETDLSTVCQQQGFPVGPYNHFLEAGHQYVALELYRTVKELYS